MRRSSNLSYAAIACAIILAFASSLPARAQNSPPPAAAIQSAPEHTHTQEAGPPAAGQSANQGMTGGMTNCPMTQADMQTMMRMMQGMMQMMQAMHGPTQPGQMAPGQMGPMQRGNTGGGSSGSH